MGQHSELNSAAYYLLSRWVFILVENLEFCSTEFFGRSMDFPSYQLSQNIIASGQALENLTGRWAWTY